ncbi:MAG: SUMF1/EgtB/PvdO family nonheme iron enzyme, partial [Patescibacteria group bacterium]
NDGYVRTAPVGVFPEGASWAGVVDMSGNVWEWVEDWHQAYLTDPTNKLVLGGSWGNTEEDVTLYSTLFKREYHTNTSAEPVSRTISIDRTYSNIKGKNYSIGIGDTVAVDFVVKGLKKGDSYLMIEDQLPAGMVPLNENLDNVKKSKTYGTIYNYVGKEYTKNGVIISDSYIGADGEQHYYYNARVVAGGDYSVPPAQAMLMYSPEIYAHSGSKIIHIENESQIVNSEGDEIITSEKNKISVRTIAFAIIGFITFGAFVAIWIFHKKS